MIDHAHLAKVKEAHKKYGFSFRATIKGQKQYVTLGYDPGKNKPVYKGHGWHGPIHRHIPLIFPNAYITSASFSGSSFEVTIRTNP